ncbi:MAG: formate dehydrogenase accessory sulfurtransferase FdhD [Acidobacteriaceae bacterium]|nr:formate dehydrogenase accessory sulfurtransferase FdhD [Acidobacteriaceae bacterium]
MHTTVQSLIRQFSIKRISNAHSERVLDSVATEEPLEIRVSYWFKDSQMSQSVAVTMRTPGNDRELAAGLLLSEGVIRDGHQITAIRSLGSEPSNEVLVELSKEVDFEIWRLSRSSFVNSSCGICGKRSRDAVAPQSSFPRDDHLSIDASLIQALPALLRERQEGFAKTGGLHAAALIDSSGRIDALFEDIGRHNALDKLIGSYVLNGRIPLRDHFFFLSSRSSFELIQKTAMAGVPMIATVGGPSSLAIETARQLGITLVGFVRSDRFNVYSGQWRINS